MADYVERSGLQVADALCDFVEGPLLQGIGTTPSTFWDGLKSLLDELAPKNKALLETRDTLQAKIDDWAEARRGAKIDIAEQKAFLTEIGYLVPAGPNFTVNTGNVDPEMSTIAGPQLVVPVMNARFALNAANARWNSLYDALYGTDALPGSPAGKGFDAARGAEAIAWTANFLDDAVPLASGSHKDVTAYRRDGGTLVAVVDGTEVGLKDPSVFVGYSEEDTTASYYLRHHRLHVVLVINPDSQVGKMSTAGLADVVLESALTSIQDCEDSVAAVDAEDKVLAYTNWLGLMRGDLSESFEKGGKTVVRKLNDDRHITAADGSALTLPGRTVSLVRNVGHLMTNPAVLSDGAEIPEGILDALVTVTAALHDMQKTDGFQNSRTGSVYIVKPKMHGPDEAAFANTLFDRVEDILGLARNTIKIGVMDEERRTSVNLFECIRRVKDRVVFINTGFLDRTGDEIHTWMQLGPVVPKEEMKNADWLVAYEIGNVEAGINAGMIGKGQIGKGMWAKPDAMADMLVEKIGHPKAGANTAWVPSPTAATLHATHYHQYDVFARMEELKGQSRFDLDALLTPPMMLNEKISYSDLQHHLDNSCQSILGYVVRWVDQGVGCSKVPDLNGVGLMEDRATLRISAQLLANWQIHGLVGEEDILESLKRMAVLVDEQNAGDADYTPMAPTFDGLAFIAARDLILKGAEQPSGYTEPLLHKFRQEVKAAG